MFFVEGGVRGVDEKIIHVADEPSFGNHVTEGVVHETLEGGGEVGESEEHHHGFKKSFVGNEGRLPLVTIFDSYVVVSPADVELSENLGVSQLVHEIGDEGKGVGVADGMFVDVMIVLARAESSILLFDKEEGRGLRGVRWADLPGC